MIALALIATGVTPAFADIPWEEATVRLAQENAKLARRPQGHAGTYFVICTLYYTPIESGFTVVRGFDARMESRRGLKGRKYPRDFLHAVRKEGVGRVTQPVRGYHYICYDGGNRFRFAKHPVGRGTDPLVPRYSAATRRGQKGLGYGVELATTDRFVQQVFRSSRWKVVDTGGGLRRWQVDLYWGEDEPLGPGRLMARPRGTTFEYAYSEARVKKN